MRTVKYKGRKGYEEHFIYTAKEADELGIPYLLEWRDFERVGQWVLTDDGMVIEILSSGKLRTGTNWLRTATGSFLTSSKSFLNTKYRESRYSFNGLKTGNQPFKLTERMKQWIHLFVLGEHPVESYLRTFNGSNREYAERRVFDLLKRPEVKQAVKEGLKEQLERLGIDDGYVLSSLKNLADGEDVNDNVRFKCLNELADIIELKPKSDIPLGGFIGFGEVVNAVESGKQLGGNPALERAQQQLLAAETLEEDFHDGE